MITFALSHLFIAHALIFARLFIAHALLGDWSDGGLLCLLYALDYETTITRIYYEEALFLGFYAPGACGLRGL